MDKETNALIQIIRFNQLGTSGHRESMCKTRVSTRKEYQRMRISTRKVNYQMRITTKTAYQQKMRSSTKTANQHRKGKSTEQLRMKYQCLKISFKPVAQILDLNNIREMVVNPSKRLSLNINVGMITTIIRW